jgi:hypothetical protein
MTSEPRPKPLLLHLNVGDRYQIRARFLPGILSILVVFPIGAAAGLAVTSWVPVLISGIGLGAVLGVAVSHLASAAGNRAQERLWPRWPHDAPTNRWLHPNDRSRSQQQKENWYDAIQRLAKLDVRAVAGDEREVQLVVEDAVSTIRARLWKTKYSDRLNVHNADYGFARNMLGLQPVWLAGAILSCGGCWALFTFRQAAVAWPGIATVILAFCLVLVWWLPEYVRQKAHRYAESFFGALLDLDRDSRAI